MYFAFYLSNFSITICCFKKSTNVRYFLSASLIFLSKFDLSVSYLVPKTNPLISILFTFAANLLSILSTSAFNLAQFDFNARLDISIPVAFLYLFLLHH